MRMTTHCAPDRERSAWRLNTLENIPSRATRLTFLVCSRRDPLPRHSDEPVSYTHLQEIAHIIERIREAGYQPHVTRGVERTIVAAVGNGRRHEIEALQVAPGVENVVAIAQPFKLVSRQAKPERSVVNVGGVATVSYTHLDVYKRQLRFR